jgi:hypothetical protein
MEEFLAAVLARAACLLVGALIMCLTRAFAATLSPGPAAMPGADRQGRGRSM